MALTPERLNDSEIANLVERGLWPADLSPPKTIKEHPLATWLYKRFKAGSGMITKHEAYDIGNALDSQQHEIAELKETVRLLKEAGGSLVRQVLTRDARP